MLKAKSKVSLKTWIAYAAETQKTRIIIGKVEKKKKKGMIWQNSELIQFFAIRFLCTSIAKAANTNVMSKANTAVD
jgi:hypothetical protein